MAVGEASADVGRAQPRLIARRVRSISKLALVVGAPTRHPIVPHQRTCMEMASSNLDDAGHHLYGRHLISVLAVTELPHAAFSPTIDGARRGDRAGVAKAHGGLAHVREPDSDGFAVAAASHLAVALQRAHLVLAHCKADDVVAKRNAL